MFAQIKAAVLAVAAKLQNAVKDGVHRFNAEVAIAGMEAALHNLLLSMEHIETILDLVKSLRDAKDEEGHPLSGAQKADLVATQLQTKGEDWLPEPARPLVHFIISTVHAIARLEGDL